MNRYDMTVLCVCDYTSYNGVKFYDGELYYSDEEYSIFELSYTMYSSSYKYMADISYDDLFKYFKVMPCVLDEITNLFNDIMNEE